MKTITIKAENWNQDQKNLLNACVYNLIYVSQGINAKVTGYFPTLEIDNDEVDETKLTDDAILEHINASITEGEAAAQVEAEEKATKEAELATNEVVGLKLGEVEAKIDAIETLDDAKSLMREILGYLKAKE